MGRKKSLVSIAREHRRQCVCTNIIPILVGLAAPILSVKNGAYSIFVWYISKDYRTTYRNVKEIPIFIPLPVYL